MKKRPSCFTEKLLQSKKREIEMSKAMVKSVEVKLDPKSGDIEKLKLDLKKLIYSTENANTVCHIPTIYSDGTGDDKNYSVSLPISKTSPLYAVGKKYYLRYNIQKEILGVVDETDPVGKQLIEASKLLKLSLCKQINEMPADKKMQLFNKCGLNYDMLADQKIETTILFKDLIENAKYSEFDAPDPSFAHKVNPTKSKSMSIGLWMKKNDEIGKSSGQIPLKNNDESSSSSSLINFTYTRICSAIGSSSPIELKDWDQAEKLLFYAKKDQKKKFEQPESAQKHFFTISKIETLAPSLYVSQGGFKLVWKMKSITVFHKEEIEYTNIIKAAKDEKMTMEYCNYVNSINESGMFIHPTFLLYMYIEINNINIF